MKLSLEQYLFIHRITVNNFAQKIGYAPQYVRTIKNWRRKPGKKFIRDVARESNDQVTFDPALVSKDAIKDQYDYCPCCNAKIPKKIILPEPAE